MSSGNLIPILKVNNAMILPTIFFAASDVKLGKYTDAIANSLLHVQQVLKKYLKSNGRIPDIDRDAKRTCAFKAYTV